MAGGQDLLYYPGDFPQDWPPGPIVPAPDNFYGVAAPDGAGADVLPTPIGNQQNTSPAAASQPPLTPAGTQGGTPTTGPGAIRVPMTLFPPF